jgi:hypothetical protein
LHHKKDTWKKPSEFLVISRNVIIEDLWWICPILSMQEKLRVLIVDYVEIFKGMCPDAHKDIDQCLPNPLVDEISITDFVDSDHAHVKVM